MTTQTLTKDWFTAAAADLNGALDDAATIWPGERDDRQPVHTVYGGAHLFRSNTTERMGELGRRALDAYAPGPTELADALGWGAGGRAVAGDVFERVLAKLEHEAVEDFRIDFEDGFGFRPDDEEDAEAARTAAEAAAGMEAGSLPPFIGIRIKPLTADLHRRSLRTLDVFVSELTRASGGVLPDGFVVTIPKITDAAQVRIVARALDELESSLGLTHGAVPVELMVETPQSIFAADGSVHLPALVAAADGRCRGLHFGTYDYTALCNITAAFQDMAHRSCDFAKHVMQVSMAQRGLMISDGATNVMPVGPHRASADAPLTPEQMAENRDVVHRAWRLQHDHIRHSLEGGFYQGWDLHPAQLPIRYAAVYAFFQEGLAQASIRLKTFVEQAAQATLVGDVFDDAATGQGLLNYFLRARACGAITADDVAATGLTESDLATRSFPKILDRLAAAPTS